MILISYAILTSSNKKEIRVKNDHDALQIAMEVLENDEVRYYEVISIVRMEELQSTTVIVETHTLNISLEIDNTTGKIICKEKLIA